MLFRSIGKLKDTFKGEEDIDTETLSKTNDVANFVKEKFISQLQNNGIKISNIEIGNGLSGAPYLRLYPKTPTDQKSIILSLEKSGIPSSTFTKFYASGKSFDFEGGKYELSHEVRSGSILVHIIKTA